ncbi:DUF2252 domain-containing protein [Mucilaginibacter sp. FT3.2]|uniref:DUF2252 domain-containing protein n=1 Tax=Mucilaginibacter sp. FT3.2 TaxID=2723090 RepID=UPI001608B385|nr:DUF2252 family protein [Mucilaginibacter sp. FT3.2]MBB6232234.1 uncharacterized protein (DUF2252 family) [Mucilaginibacter sp. FT3.2]
MSKLSERLNEFNKNLLPQMVQLKYQLMAESAFRFFRGTCHLFYEDLSKVKPVTGFPATWICGDLHLENFGSFKANNRMVYFDLNDFDESALAYANWELLRVVTSIFVGFDSLQIKQSEAKEMAQMFLDVYSATLSKAKARYIDPRTAQGIIKEFLEKAEERKARELVTKQTDAKELQLKIDNRTHFKIEKSLKKELIAHIDNWLKKNNDWPGNYKVIDAAFRVAGTGSVGLKRYMFLLQGIKNKKKLLVIEMKQGVKSSLSPYNLVKQPGWKSDAERIISIKYRMQNVSPALLSTTVFQENAYIIQEMQPSADKIKFELIKDDHKCIKRVLTDMAVLTASAQIRSGGIQGSANIDELILLGNRTDWQKPIISYAARYAGQVKKDYQQFIDEYKQGTLN